MTPATVGAAIGAVFGLANLFILQNLADRMVRDSKSKDGQQMSKFLRSMAWIDLMIFPVIGWLVGPLVAG